MIGKVEAYLASKLTKKAIDTFRAKSAEKHVHHMSIRKDIVTKMLNNEMVKLKNAGKITATGGQISLAADDAWDQVYTEKNILTEMNKGFSKYGNPGDETWIRDDSSSTNIIVVYDSGLYARTVSYGTGLTPIINHVMKVLWRQAFVKIRAFMKDATGAKFGSASGAAKTPGHPGLRAHGEIGKVDPETHMPSTDQDTMAVGSVGENWDAEMDSLYTQMSNEYPASGKEVDLVMRHYTEAFEREYKISDKQDFTAEGGEREWVIQCTYGDAVVNKDKTVGKADAGGIKKMIEDENAAIVAAVSKDLNMEDVEGSPSFKTKISAVVPAMMIQKMFKHHKSRPDMRLKVNKRLALASKKAQGKKLTTGSIILAAAKATQKAQKAQSVGKKRVKGDASQKASQRASSKTLESPIALRNILNETLPQVVASKMTQPALQFRTGRFANSVRVENVVPGPRGGTYVDYTYDKMPYQTFEPGFKQGSTVRDPRKIIGESIRQIAMGILGRKFTAIRRI